MKGKLVRDKIPQIILQKENKCPKTRILKAREYKRELYKKLQEEVSEVLAASKYKISEEVADVEEVIDAILALHSISRKKVIELQAQKRKDRGGFKKRIYLIR